MELKDILSILKQHKSILSEKFSVKEIGVFGSYAKGISTDQSDIDFYVVFQDKTVDNITGLWIYLENLYDKKIDLLHHHKRLRDSLKREIEKDIIYG